jgi:hypothetical protein
MVEEYQRAYDVLGGSGARVLWIQNACIGNEVPSLLSDLVEPITPSVIRHVNEDVLTRVAEGRPGLQLFDLFPILCPDGSYVPSVGGVKNVRPDGIHYSPEGGRWLAEQYGPEMIETGLG